MKNVSYFVKTSLTLLGFVLLLTACEKNIDRLPYQVDNIFTVEEEAVLSKYLETNKFNYIRNVTEADQYKVFLGRVLFYDSNLSADRSVACASCHQQDKGFADDVAFSRGASGNMTDRNSISLAAFSSFSGHYGDGGEETDLVENSFFWDERVGHISEQLTQTFANPNEMGMTISEIGSRVETLDYATILYKKAFKGQSITSENVIDAIAAFVNTIKAPSTPFDNALFHIRHDITVDFPPFTIEQNKGKNLFLDNCASCHAFSLSTSFRHEFGNNATVASNGLDREYADKGIGRHTGLAENNGVFKIPGIRNIALTAPYMHDGRFETLEDVVDFYSEGIQAHPNLDPKLKDENGAPKRMNFSDSDKADLITFLNTLTSTISVTDESLSNPFKE